VLRSLAAVVAGFLVLVVLILGSTPILVRILLPEPGQRPSAAYLIANLLTGFAFAGVGGWVAAHLAPRAPVVHGGVMAAIVLAVGVLTAAQGGAARSGQPPWYAWALPFVGAAGVMIGATW
jgi:hypothetical protein